jgi:hypothetical protein
MATLNDIPKTNPFQVPDNYFEQLEQEVMMKVKQEQQEQKQKHLRHRRIYTIISAAAAVVALLVMINHWFVMPENKPQDTQLAESASTTNVLLASSSDNGVLSTGEAVPDVEIEEVDFDNIDYQILDYYSDEMSELDLLY